MCRIYGKFASYFSRINGPNPLIDRTVTLDCHRERRNLSMAWIDVKKAYNSAGHGWSNGVKLLHRSLVWLCRVMAKLCRSYNKRVLVVTRKGTETSEPIRFSKGVHEKVGLSFHREKEYIRIQWFTQGFCHLNLSGITKFKYAHKTWIMDSGGEVKCQG